MGKTLSKLNQSCQKIRKIFPSNTFTLYTHKATASYIVHNIVLLFCPGMIDGFVVSGFISAVEGI